MPTNVVLASGSDRASSRTSRKIDDFMTHFEVIDDDDYGELPFFVVTIVYDKMVTKKLAHKS